MNSSTAEDDGRATDAASLLRVTHWNGVAETYDAYRPAAPSALPPLLTQLAEAPRPALVVDLGCGTGLSTLLWADVGQQVIGVEPNDEMRAQAERRAARMRPAATHLRFVGATAERSGLPDGCADIVTASQSFHWMEPTATLAEVARILRRGGVFAAYDYDWPPTVTWESDALFHRFMARVFAVAEARGKRVGPVGWEKSGHLERMRASGHFHMVKEMGLHNIEQGDAERFIGLTLSMSSILAFGEVTAEEVDLAAYQRAARETLPATEIPWYISYHVRLAVK
ncbi:MAG TPA: class I SAM-dependent methyltransferase [Ktedonobacterales bacterium]|nr:class I SAM-dependent methyltransferase [Ktedonobacterales bacterium]